MDARKVKEAARRFGADLVGITAFENFRDLPPEKNPMSIFPQGKSMIVIGRRISRGTLRAVENGRWVLRAANTGISSVISSEGKTITHLDALTKGYIVENAYTHSERTLYSYIGDTIVLLCFGITLFEGASVIFKKRR